MKLVVGGETEKSHGTNCRLFKRGRINDWDELLLFGIWDELSLGTNCRLGRIVAQPKTISESEGQHLWLFYGPVRLMRVFNNCAEDL